MPLTPVALEPETVEEALAALAEHGDDAKVVAGATAVTIMLRQRLIAPDVLVFLHRIRELREIGSDGSSIRIEALATHHDVATSPIVRQAIPALADVFSVVGNVRVRSVATVGGVLAEADYASDPPCALLALGAEVEVRGPSPRTIPIADFFQGFYETALKDDELVTAVRIPVPTPGTTAAYEKYRTRSSEDRPCVGVFAATRLDGGGRLEELRVAVGAASETPQRFPDLEAAGTGRPLDEALAAEVAEAYAERVDTLDDMRGSAWYRSEMIRVWVRRTILRAAGIPE
jgi:carbon-monoxide dehydrogenase medium subunit